MGRTGPDLRKRHHISRSHNYRSTCGQVDNTSAGVRTLPGKPVYTAAE
jgi:hypothetical protein